LLIDTSSIRIGVTNQGEKEVAQKERGEMTKVVSPATQEVAKTTPAVVKVSRKVVELINELSEVRAIANSADARVEELRKAIFAKVGKADQILIHNSIEVARIIESNPERLSEEFLKANFPDAYEASVKPRQQFTIRSVTRQAK